MKYSTIFFLFGFKKEFILNFYSVHYAVKCLAYVLCVVV